jgi:hypothetical protein
MYSLPELQTGFADALFRQREDAIVGAIRTNGLDRARRLQVYRNNMETSLTGALAAVYPVVERLVGERFFRFAARRYIPRHPSRSGNLHDFGREFPDFLAHFAPAAGLPYLTDVARLEWAYHSVFHAADAVPLNPSALARIPAEDIGRIRFRLHPACRLLSSPFPILHIWQVNQAGYAGDQTVDLAEGGVKMLVIRNGLEIEMHCLADGEFAWLKALDSGADFASAGERALRADAGMDLAACVERHARMTLAGFALAENEGALPPMH